MKKRKKELLLILESRIDGVSFGLMYDFDSTLITKTFLLPG